MDSKTFLAESARTLSDQYHDELVPPGLLRRVLDEAIAAGERIDAIKKSLFYGRALPPALAREAAATAPSLHFTPRAVDPRLLHAALGVLGEAVELLQALDKPMTGGTLDTVNLLEEVGDVEWFLAIFYRYANLLPEDVRAIVIAKLRKRYPERFTTAAAVDRDLGAERALLEEGAALARAGSDTEPLRAAYPGLRDLQETAAALAHATGADKAALAQRLAETVRANAEDLAAFILGRGPR